MTRDPFDMLHDRDPVPAEDRPRAPMALAERIIGRRRRTDLSAMPGWALAVTAAVVVAVAGGALLLLFRPQDGGGVADGGTTLPPPTTTSTDEGGASVPPTSVPTVETVERVVYFFAEPQGPGWSGGPFLMPVALPTPSSSTMASEASAALEQLLMGPEGLQVGALGWPVREDDPVGPDLTTAIPMGTGYNRVVFDDATGVVSVDLSEAFVSGGGAASMRARLAQVIYTLTAIDGIEGVRFVIDGTPTTVFGGDGIVVDDPATRDGFDDLLPAILIESPAFGGNAGSPLVASGSANVYEATVSAALRDLDGAALWDGFTTATDWLDRRGDWEIVIEYDIDSPRWGILAVWEDSAEDGSVRNLREHLVWLTPADGTDTTPTIPPMDCSGRDWETPLLDQVGLPAAVAETRDAIWSATTTCDWEALLGLMAGDFSYSFGHPAEGTIDAIRYWQDLEAAGGRPMFYLAELLTRPHGDRFLVESYVWPSAFAYPDWATVPVADREALRPLYGDEDFEDFADFGGYIGYRVGIDEEGVWRFFIAGD